MTQSCRKVVAVSVGGTVLAAAVTVCAVWVPPLIVLHGPLKAVAEYRIKPGAAVDSLGGSRRAVSLVRRYLSLPDVVAPRKGAAVTLLGRCGPSAVPLIVKALADDDPEVRIGAAWAAGRLGPCGRNVAVALAEAAFNFADTGRAASVAKDSLILLGPHAAPAVPRLIKALDEDMLARLTALKLIKKMGPVAKAAIPRLLAAARKPDSETRQEAVAALIRTGPQSVPGLVGMGAEVVPDLIAALGGPWPAPETSIPALVGIGPDSVPDLIKALARQDLAVQAGAVRALGAIGAAARTAVPALERIAASGDYRLRGLAAQALQRIRGR